MNCTLCFNDKLKSLSSCVITCSNLDPANLRSHIQRMHPDVAHKLCNESTKKRSRSTESGTICSAGSSNCFAPRLPGRVVQEIGDRLLYHFMSKANIAARHSNAPHLQHYVSHCLSNVLYYSSGLQKIGLSRNKYETQRLKSFTTFTSVVHQMVARARAYYLEVSLGNRSIGFINVCHDGWDLKDHDILGVSICFVDPIQGKIFCAAVGLQRMSSKKAVDVANQIKSILER